MQGSRLAFGPFVFDPDAGTLLRSGEPVAIGQRGLALLAALAEHPGAILGKAELMEAAWPGIALEEGNLTVQISLLRKALGQMPGGGEWIATVPRVGYRFAGALERLEGSGRERPALPAKPSIAVLPFVDLGGEPAGEVFAAGLTEDLITDLSRQAGLFVIARNSAFAFRGRAVDPRAVAAELGVRYLLEGSARRAAGRVRINAQLVDAASGAHVWAERFDRDAGDVFAVQDEVTASIVAALTGRLVTAPPRRRPKNMEAYDLCVRARRLMDDAPQAAQEAHLMLTRAIALDPDYAEPYRWLAVNHWMGQVHAGGPDEASRDRALDLARKAAALDPEDAGCRSILAYLLAYARRFAEADAEFERAIALDPNEADTWAALSDIAVLAGRVEEGLQQARKAFRLNPFPPGWYHLILGQALYAARDYEAAVAALSAEAIYATSSRRFLAASLAQLGRLEAARAEADLFLVANPHFSIGHFVASEPFRDEAMRAHFVDGFRKAGFPE